MTDKPTAERILKAFAAISLTIIKNAAGEDILRRLTPLSGLQEDILQRLGLGAALYGQLEMQAIGNGSSPSLRPASESDRKRLRAGY